MPGAAGTDGLGMVSARRRCVAAGVLLGAGVVAFADEVVFHEILHWHHFYDRGGANWGLVTDGVLSAGVLVLTVAGFFLLADLLRRQVAVPGLVWAGGLLGGGGFQLFDGLIDHKVLRVHQIRYGVDLLPYDLAWDLAGAALLVAGLVLLARQVRAVRASLG